MEFENVEFARIATLAMNRPRSRGRGRERERQYAYVIAKRRIEIRKKTRKLVSIVFKMIIIEKERISLPIRNGRTNYENGGLNEHKTYPIRSRIDLYL